MTRFFAAAITAFALVFGAVAPASACGPYGGGDPISQAEWELELWASHLTSVRAGLDAAIESGDAADIREQLGYFEAALTGHDEAADRLAALQAETEAEVARLADAK